MVSPADFRPRGDLAGVDFETYYSKDYSVKDLGNFAYVHDPRFNAWAVSVTDGVTACSCRPADFPWDRIDGIDWVSHNREFDRSVYGRLQELGVCPAAAPRAWHCSAAACAFLQYPRDLAGAALAVLGVAADKGVRKNSTGVRGDAAQATLFETDILEEEARYVANDAVVSLALWCAVGPLWPAHERRLFEMTCAMGRRGLSLDWGTVDAKRLEIGARADSLKAALPWKPALSPKKFAAAVRATGVTPPDSTAAGDEDFQAWAEDHAGTPAGQWAADVGQIRRCGRLAGVLEGMRLRRQPDSGRMAYELKYFGATPGRWSGGGGLNVQNLNRREAEGVGLRKCVVAPPGYVLGVADYSQIEARVLLFLAGDTAALELLGRHPEWDMYELHARATMGWRPETGGQRTEFSGETLNAERSALNAQGEREESLKDFCERTGSGLRQLAKARVLGLGFRCGAATFVRVARAMAGLRININDACRIVEEYRDSNPKIVRLWNRLETEAAKALRAEPHEYRLAFPCTAADPRCGRYLYYRDIRRCQRGRGLEAVVAGERVPLHGGIIAENWTQGTARDVLASAWLRCVSEGFSPVLSVHDELVFELREETAGEDLKKIVAVMEKPLAWAPGLPLRASAKLTGRYGK